MNATGTSPRNSSATPTADGSRATLADVRIADVHERLSHAVAFENRVSEELAKSSEHMRGQRRGTGDEESHRFPDSLRDVARRFEQTHVNRRHAEEERRL